MGGKTLVFLIIAFLLISGCSIGKTKPVVTDITGAAVQEPSTDTEEITEQNDTVEQNETAEQNETTIEEPEINETEEVPEGTHIITIKDLKLEPRELTIKKGDIVVWKHEDEWEEDEETKHYLAAHSNEFRTPILYNGDTFEHTFENEGIFTYIDVLYKERDYMRGKIIVE